MSKQTIIGLSLITVIIAGIGFWLYRSPRPADEVLPIDPLAQLFSDVQAEFGLAEPLADAEVSWNVQVDDEIRAMTFSGQILAFQSADSEVESAVRQYLLGHDFVIDKLNVAAGPAASLTGYQKDDQICTLAVNSPLDQSGLLVAGLPTAYGLACAHANFAIAPVISTEQAMQQLFADKYQTKKSAVAILIEQEGVNHVRGSVRILDAASSDPNASSGQGTGGIFLAAKVDGEWVLVFDGNGAISCELVEGYGFPSEMIKDCSDNRALSVKVGEEFTIVLDSNPTTGYSWEATIDSELVSLAGKDYEAKGAEMVGAGGEEIFTLQAKEVGQAEIIFSYLRPWEGAPIKQITYFINISN
ncbi:protease inhibitor I42 family protein [Patescibacteria group bacterium]|nr:protease inhibitor I42 family protein [Patescibacteria group bacterium]MBU1705229.1 protease inhibitor I42 family protein [Patescibacteria group bacterium]